MSEEEKKVLVRRYIKAWNEGQLDQLDDLCSPDFIDHDPYSPKEGQQGLEALKVTIRRLRRSFPDSEGTILEQIAEGDMLVSRWSVTGTHSDVILGVPATGRSVRVGGTTVYRFGEDGRLAESWTDWDVYGLLQQLGVVPELDVEAPQAEQASAPA